jgi:GT2 family glycosyltransferase
MTFSVIVPTYNRLSQLKKTLTSLFGQSYTSYEIIVVNDGGSDGSHEYLQDLSSQGKIKYYHHANSGLAATRKAGLQYAEGTFVAFTDDDCVLPPDWLHKLYDWFTDDSVAGVGGPTQTGDPLNPYADVNDFINNYFKSRLNSRAGQDPYLTGNNVAFRRSALEKVGGPDPKFRMGAEDRDLLLRIHRAGGKIIYDPAIVIEHYNNSNFYGFVRHQFVQGKGSYLFYTNTKKSSGCRPTPIPLKVYTGLLLSPFSSRPFPRALFLSVLIILAQVSVTAGFFSALLKKQSHPE